jgi:nitrogenase molybdenum-iron protein alpha/beta subunit
MAKFSGLEVSSEGTLTIGEGGSKSLKSLAKKMREQHGSGDDLPIEDRKAYKKFSNKFGPEAAEVFLRKNRQELEDVISYNVLEVSKAKEEVEATPEYKSAAQALKDLKGGLKDVIDPMKSAIELATLIINQNFPDKESK